MYVSYTLGKIYVRVSVKYMWVCMHVRMCVCEYGCMYIYQGRIQTENRSVQIF